MHRKKAVKNVGLQELAARKKKLHPHKRGHDARDDKEYQARPDIHQPELFVVHRIDEFLNDPGQRTRLLSYAFRRSWYILLFRFYCCRWISHNI